MKKLIFLSIITVFIFSNVDAQNGEFNAGISAGIPVGDAGEFTTFSLAVDLEYLFGISEDFQLGPTVGYSTSFLDSDFDGDNISFLPIAAAGRLAVSEELTAGVDLGYGLGVNEGNDGGFYFATKVLYQITDTLNLMLAYRSLSENGGSFNIISFGILINIIDMATSI